MHLLVDLHSDICANFHVNVSFSRVRLVVAFLLVFLYHIAARGGLLDAGRAPIILEHTGRTVRRY